MRGHGLNPVLLQMNFFPGVVRECPTTSGFTS